MNEASSMRSTGLANEVRTDGSAADPIPTGTITFLFSDIEASTRRWDADLPAMSEAVARHDRLARNVINARHGHIFKTLGDGFCCAFASPSDALMAGLDLQRVLAAQDFSAVDGLRIRVALHTGMAEERDGDYFGPTVNRVARLLSTAHGEQVIVSGVTHDLAHQSVAAWGTFKDLGVHRLKDLSRPERIYQLVARGLRSEFPPLRSLTAFPNNLPAHLTSFFGREREVADIARSLERKRLVTLVGSGGVGKTRASLQVAANLLDGSGDGVWLIELAPLESGAYLPATVAQSLSLGPLPDGDPLEHLVRMLRAKRMLLIFDNCEHIIDSAATVVAALLRGCPQIKVLASSRQALGISGEETFRLPSLEVPEQGSAAGRPVANDAMRCSAVALFVDRAHAVDKRFALTEDNAEVVSDVCRRLDGIALAIELAAARVKVLTPRQLRERLDERFGVLTGGSRDALPRQQTLRALIDWSYDLLSDAERKLFRQLGIFVNGFALEGAFAVGASPPSVEADTFDLLSSLIDKSLVLAEPSDDGFRYRLLESTRAYAYEKLAAAGERDACANRHARYLRDRFAAAYERYRHTLRPADIDGLLVVELDDVRSALDNALKGPDVTLGGELLAQFRRAWGATGLYREGLARTLDFEAALKASDPNLLARILAIAPLFAAELGQDTLAFEIATRALAYARASNDPQTLAEVLIRFANVLIRCERIVEAGATLREAQGLGEFSAGIRLLFLAVKAKLAAKTGDYSAAARIHEDLRGTYRSLGNIDGEIAQTINLATAEYRGGRVERAIELLRNLLPLARAQPNRITLAQALTNLGCYLVSVDAPGDACESLREAIAEFADREPGAAFIATAIELLALGLALGGDSSLAATLAGYAAATLSKHGSSRQHGEALSHARLLVVLGSNLTESDRLRLLAEGAALVPGAAVALALRGWQRT